MPRRPGLPRSSRKSTRSSPSRRMGKGAPPTGSSSDNAAGCQYRRMRSPHAVPGPIRVSSSWTSCGSISPSSNSAVRSLRLNAPRRLLDRYLVGHHDLAPLGRGLQHAEADLKRRLPPAAVVEHGLAVHNRLVQLRNLRLPTEHLVGDRDLGNLAVAVDQDAILRLAHLALLAARHSQPVEPLVTRRPRGIAVLTPAVLAQLVRPLMAVGLRAGLAVARVVLQLLENALPLGPANLVECLARVLVAARIARLAEPPGQLPRVEVAVAGEDESGERAVFELHEAAKSTFRTGRITPVRRNRAHAAHHATAQQPDDVHLVRPLVQHDAATHDQLAVRVRAHEEVVVVPGVDHPQLPSWPLVMISRIFRI